MGYRIEGIEIESFRGIRRLSLPLEGRNLIVVGENGSGKSSIVDAIEYFFTGGIQHLEGRADVKKRMSVPNLMGGVPRVTMRLGDGSSTKEVSRVYGRRDEGIPAGWRRSGSGSWSGCRASWRGWTSWQARRRWRDWSANDWAWRTRTG